MGGPNNGGRQQSFEALRESEELHRATLSSISDAVFMANDAGEFTYVCPCRVDPFRRARLEPDRKGSAHHQALRLQTAIQGAIGRAEAVLVGV